MKKLFIVTHFFAEMCRRWIGYPEVHPPEIIKQGPTAQRGGGYSGA